MSTQITWTAPLHGVTHGYLTATPSLAKKWVTVTEIGDCAGLICINLGFETIASSHMSVAEAKQAGEAWMSR